MNNPTSGAPVAAAAPTAKGPVTGSIGSLGGSIELFPGVQVMGSAGRDGWYAIGGAGVGGSAKASVEFPLGDVTVFHSQSSGYKGGFGAAGNAQVGLPVAAWTDSFFGTALLAPAYDIKGPVGIDVTAFANFSNGQFNYRLDVDLVPVVGVSGVIGGGYDARH